MFGTPHRIYLRKTEKGFFCNILGSCDHITVKRVSEKLKASNIDCYLWTENDSEGWKWLCLAIRWDLEPWKAILALQILATNCTRNWCNWEYYEYMKLKELAGDPKLKVNLTLGEVTYG